MKSVGIIGGIGPESTIQYYRDIINGYKKKITDGSSPSIVINSIDIIKMLNLLSTNEDELVKYLNDEIYKLKNSGVDFAVLAANTPHAIFEKLQAVSPLRLISIVEVTRDKSSELGLKKILLLGTKFTMTGNFYPKVFAEKNIEVVAPNAEQQNYIHQIYFDELIKGVIRQETKQQLLKIISDIKSQNHIDGIVLGGTELSLILKEEKYENLPILDTTNLHIQRIVKEILVSQMGLK